MATRVIQQYSVLLLRRKRYWDARRRDGQRGKRQRRFARSQSTVN
jgi:hypothetical protein